MSLVTRFGQMCCILLVVSLTGCASLQLSLKNSSVQKPSNVALYFSVETQENVPVPGLDAETFRIYEDDQLISPFESQQTILNQEVAVTHYTLLLLDLSGSITESGSLPSLIQAATLFAEKITRNQMISVYGFDGSPKLIPIVPSTSKVQQVTQGLRRLQNYQVKDPSTNLNGALVAATQVLDQAVKTSKRPLTFGTLVVFTDGTDRAHRISEAEMLQTLHNAPFNVFAIGLGGEISAQQLDNISNIGYMQADNLDGIADAFEHVAEIIESAAHKFYLLSYCSPSRAGMHTLRVEVTHHELTGSLTHQFDATGFGPGCNPIAKPKFQKSHIQMGTTRISPRSQTLHETNE